MLAKPDVGALKKLKRIGLLRKSDAYLMRRLGRESEFFGCFGSSASERRRIMRDILARIT